MVFFWKRGQQSPKKTRSPHRQHHHQQQQQADDISDHVDPTHSPDYSEVDETSENNFSDEDSVSEDEWEGRAIRHLMWRDDSFYSGVFQIYGSVWPKVLPYCILNVLWAFAIYYLKHDCGIDLTVAPSGHKYTAPLMSFLLVTRLNITFKNYMSHAKNLRTLYKACRDLIANICLLTANDTSRKAKQWRQDVTYSTLVMLRVAMGVLEFRTSHKNPWLLPEMEKENSEEVIKYSFKDHEEELNEEVKTKGEESHHDHVRASIVNSQWSGVEENDEEVLHMPTLKKALAHVDDKDRNVMEEASRAVYVLAWNVRRDIMKQRDDTWFQRRGLVWEHPVNEEKMLLDYVAEFLKAFAGCYKYITTPIPMPLVQMCKVFLFVWLFTLPLTLVHVSMNHLVDPPVVSSLVVFILTFGFMGLEYVSMEMSDPFGDEPSDFDDLGQAQLAMEDCYIAIYRLDGKMWAKALRKRLKTKEEVQVPLSNSGSPPANAEKIFRKSQTF